MKPDRIIAFVMAGGPGPPPPTPSPDPRRGRRRRRPSLRGPAPVKLSEATDTNRRLARNQARQIGSRPITTVPLVGQPAMNPARCPAIA